jgi:polyisoprenyl-phosphate glycosyltransferase
VRGMVAWLGFNQVPIRYTRPQRRHGTTKWPFRKMARFAIDAITGFSISPLHLGSVLALICFVATGLAAAYVLYAWFALSVVRGWASVLIIFLLFTGVQLLVLGVIGEYIGRIYFEVKRRPLFIVSEIVTQRGVESKVG